MNTLIGQTFTIATEDQLIGYDIIDNCVVNAGIGPTFIKLKEGAVITRCTFIGRVVFGAHKCIFGGSPEMGNIFWGGNTEIQQGNITCKFGDSWLSINDNEFSYNTLHYGTEEQFGFDIGSFGYGQITAKSGNYITITLPSGDVGYWGYDFGPDDRGDWTFTNQLGGATTDPDGGTAFYVAPPPSNCIGSHFVVNNPQNDGARGLYYKIIGQTYIDDHNSVLVLDTSVYDCDLLSLGDMVSVGPAFINNHIHHNNFLTDSMYWPHTYGEARVDYDVGIGHHCCVSLYVGCHNNLLENNLMKADPPFSWWDLPENRTDHYGSLGVSVNMITNYVDPGGMAQMAPSYNKIIGNRMEGLYAGIMCTTNELYNQKNLDGNIWGSWAAKPPSPENLQRVNHNEFRNNTMTPGTRNFVTYAKDVIWINNTDFNGNQLTPDITNGLLFTNQLVYPMFFDAYGSDITDTTFKDVFEFDFSQQPFLIGVSNGVISLAYGTYDVEREDIEVDVTTSVSIQSILVFREIAQTLVNMGVTASSVQSMLEGIGTLVQSVVSSNDVAKQLENVLVTINSIPTVTDVYIKANEPFAPFLFTQQPEHAGSGVVAYGTLDKEREDAASSVEAVSSVADMVQYLTSLLTTIQAIPTAADLVTMLENIVTEITVETSVTDNVIRNIEGYLTSTTEVITEVADAQLMVDNVTIMAQSGASLQTIFRYLEQITNTISTVTSVRDAIIGVFDGVFIFTNTVRPRIFDDIVTLRNFDCSVYPRIFENMCTPEVSK